MPRSLQRGAQQSFDCSFFREMLYLNYFFLIDFYVCVQKMPGRPDIGPGVPGYLPGGIASPRQGKVGDKLVREVRVHRRSGSQLGEQALLQPSCLRSSAGKPPLTQSTCAFAAGPDGYAAAGGRQCETFHGDPGVPAPFSVRMAESACLLATCSGRFELWDIPSTSPSD